MSKFSAFSASCGWSLCKYNIPIYTDNYYYEKFKLTTKTPKQEIPIAIQPVMTIEKALDNLQKVCDNTNTNCIELAVLRDAGWEIIINNALSSDDRKGFQITILPPKDSK